MSYTCDSCDQEFEHRKTFKNHKKTCGIQRLSDIQEFDQIGDVSKIIRSSDYSQEQKSKKIQKSLKNKEVNYSW